MKNNKSELRKKLIASRLEITPDAAKVAANSLAVHLLEIIPAGAKVAGYYAMRGEIHVEPALLALSKRGNVTCLPVVDYINKTLKFLEYTPDSKLVAGKYGTSNPPPNMPEIVPDIIIAPIVGFDASGNRLGYGGGYYDATIRSLRAANSHLVVIGVAYELQKIEAIISEEHDEKMDNIVTENGLVT